MKIRLPKYIFPFLLILAVCGCSPRVRSQITFTQLLHQLADTTRIARLDEMETSIISSSDPTGGNNDFNRPLRVASDGWWVIADLKGPGYVSRFWFTTSDHYQKIRLFFDNEESPRIDTTVRAFCGGMAPFVKPLAAYENLCYYNYVPIPYAKRLVIAVEPGGHQPGNWPRVFHQINYSSLPRGTRIESFSLPLSDSEMQALQVAAAAWMSNGVKSFNESSPSEADDDTKPDKIFTTRSSLLTLSPADAGSAPDLVGPAMIREIRVILRPAPDIPVVDSERFLRDIVIRIRWNNADEWSVESPLGDFFGSFWQSIPYESLYFGLRDNTLFSRFPMPFQNCAEIQFENQGVHPVQLEVQIDTHPITWDDSLGYFHAAWRRSSPHDLGRPHEILNTKGRGRFAGCILSVTTLDKSFWILEGDEIMWRDGQVHPFWDGTGLEDYFNGGWYYQNVLARPLHGLPFKAFFRTVQYRIHLPDAVMFQNAFRMIFERGPANNSRGWMESVAYYYLDSPRQAPATIEAAADRLPPEDQLAQISVMPELFNYERFGDYHGAQRFIDRFLARYPEFPFAEMLQLRRAAYTEKIEGFDVAKPLYESFATNAVNESVRQQASDLLWFHESETNALLGIYCNTDMRLFLDGRTIIKPGENERMSIYRHELDKGKHALAFQVRDRPYPYWVQVFLRTHSEDVFTTTGWKHQYNPVGNWRSAAYDDSDWPLVGWTANKGPPDEPLIWVEPNAFVDMQTKPDSLWPTIDWPDKGKPLVFRNTFHIP